MYLCLEIPSELTWHFVTSLAIPPVNDFTRQTFLAVFILLNHASDRSLCVYDLLLMCFRVWALRGTFKFLYFMNYLMAVLCGLTLSHINITPELRDKKTLIKSPAYLFIFFFVSVYRINCWERSKNNRRKVVECGFN